MAATDPAMAAGTLCLRQPSAAARTPLEEQAAATRGLAGAQRIRVRNGGHNLFEAHPDVPGIPIDFFSGRPVTRTELALPQPSLRPRSS
jgi:hypothetical protein